MPQEQLPLPADFAREVIDVPVADEMSESFLAYSLSVITSRAIPDVRDGLKPVQRRILYSMLNMGIRPDRPHRKCARVVGDTMGNFHPHGDSAIYDALVRMGQDFAKNVTLIDPQGNFGSLDEPPAAHRYTECRLSQAAMSMLDELDENTVEFRPTYDGESTEPECLPALLPNLLVNGTSGIAVGMATSMAPHNLAEVTEAIRIVVTKRRPKPTVHELMAVMPGPDFPSGSIVVDDGLAEIYATGKGSITVRARAHIEQLTPKRQGIIITELPYLVGPEKVVARINSLLQDDKLEGVTSVTNLSDRTSGLRLQIDCQVGVNPQAVLAQLYRMTPLEDTFTVNNVALVDGVPTTLPLYDLCLHYVNHRLDVIVRRTQYRLERAQARLHVVEGLLIALDNIDQVISIIRNSETVPEAREKLCEELDLTEIQATHILDMQFRRLVGLERQKLIDERDELVTTIEGYEQLLGSENRQRKLVMAELDELVEEYGRERRTEIVNAGDIETFTMDDISQPSEVSEEACVVTLTTSGQVGRESIEGAKRNKPGRHDLVIGRIETSTTSLVWAITSEGRALSAVVHDVGDVAGRTRGTPGDQLFGMNKGERVLALVSGPIDGHLVLISRLGTAKRLTVEELEGTRSGSTVMRLKDGDELAAAFVCADGADVIIVADNANALRTGVDAISIQGRGASGVAGMKLKDDAKVIAAGPVDPEVWDGVIVSVAPGAEAKATPFDELPSKGRGTGGVRLHKLRDNRPLLSAYVGSSEDLWVLMSTDEDHSKLDPTPVRFPLEPTKRDLSATSTDRQILTLGRVRW
ncbi:MAG: DNA topoisomerase (ATP-hydrolyzing) [Actinomycetota bacterium]